MCRHRSVSGLRGHRSSTLPRSRAIRGRRGRPRLASNVQRPDSRTAQPGADRRGDSHLRPPFPFRPDFTRLPFPTVNVNSDKFGQLRHMQQFGLALMGSLVTAASVEACGVRWCPIACMTSRSTMLQVSRCFLSERRRQFFIRVVEVQVAVTTNLDLGQRGGLAGVL